MSDGVHRLLATVVQGGYYIGCGACIAVNLESLLVAIGKPAYGFAQNCARAAWTLLALPAGWYIWGLKGVVFAVGLSEMPVIIALWYGVWREGILRIVAELLSIGFVGAGAIGGLGIALLMRLADF